MKAHSTTAAGRVRRWSLAATAALAVAGICASPLLAATPPSRPDDAIAQAKSGTARPMTDAESEKALGVPLEDAGGGWHAVLLKSSDSFREALTAGGYTVDTMALDYDNKRAIAYVAGRLPDAATVARYSRQAVAQGFSTQIVPVWRTEADAIKQQDRIDNDRKALAARGIEIGVTGITADATVSVDVYNGTQEKADYLGKTYGPKGLQINIGGVPHLNDGVGHGLPPTAR